MSRFWWMDMSMTYAISYVRVRQKRFGLFSRWEVTWATFWSPCSTPRGTRPHDGFESPFGFYDPIGGPTAGGTRWTPITGGTQT